MGVVSKEKRGEVFGELLVRDELEEFILMPCLDDQVIRVIRASGEVDL